ncbi:hypothetical protein [Streptosporangium vulgare]|uniref:hypothetical protein n=1 Tax=Streptosporangium vulgare TaxID=46190 RepID=UPI0031D9B753
MALSLKEFCRMIRFLSLSSRSDRLSADRSPNRADRGLRPRGDRDDGFEGLVPSTELAGNEVEVGDILTVKINLVDVIRRRIGLTLVQAPTGLNGADDGHV